MSIDLSEFHDIFFEECFEGLEVLESGLLNLDQNTDVEEINAIFRAAHSIKGGGASFGFTDISDFTHVMETLLDEMRDGRRAITREVVDLLLKSVDCLRDMTNAAKNSEDSDQQRTAAIKQQLEDMLATDGDTKPVTHNDTTQTKVSEDTACSPVEWLIHFRPDSEMLQTGNEPTRLFRELATLGEISVQADMSNLPAYDELNPECCYLGWELVLKGDINKEQIDELFDWVKDCSDLEITPLGNYNQPSTEAVTQADNTATAEAGTTNNDSKNAIQKAKVTDKPKGSGAGKESGSIRVAIDKIDELINLVGELVISQSMLSQIGNHLEDTDLSNTEILRDGLSQLERNTRELQESVLKIRMLPISFSFSRFPRLVRDLSSKVGKQVELKLSGEQTEVDKTVLEKIGDPLVHLVRNSLDHGLETPEIRKANNKPETGSLCLNAYHEGSEIVIEVSDDGAGLNKDRILNKAIEKGLVAENQELTDEQIYNLIFQPGFSTAEQVSDVSGRGVGMDVVRRNIRDLGGNVSITSQPDKGSTVTIRLPLTLAILDGQLTSVGEQTYILSLVSIIESLQVIPEHVSSITGQAEFYQLRDEYIPIIRLSEEFEVEQSSDDLSQGLLVVVEAEGQRYGLFVDDLMGQQQVVIKSLETNFKQLQGISGATILGDGTVALILDVPGLIQRHYEKRNTAMKPVSDVA